MEAPGDVEPVVEPGTVVVEPVEPVEPVDPVEPVEPVEPEPPRPLRRPAEGLFIDAPPVGVATPPPPPPPGPTPLPARPPAELPPLVPTWMVVAGVLGLVALLVVLLLGR